MASSPTETCSPNYFASYNCRQMRRKKSSDVIKEGWRRGGYMCLSREKSHRGE